MRFLGKLFTAGAALWGALALSTCAVPALAQTVAYPPSVVGSQGVGYGAPGGVYTTVSPTTPLPTDAVVRSTPVDRGAVIATAGTAQQLMAANSARRGYSVQNQSAGACYISGLATATADYHSLRIDAGSYYETPAGHTGTGAISIVCATAAASVFAREW